MGLYFGYYKSPTLFGFKTIINFILPFTAIVISSEILRKRLIVQKGKASSVIVFIAMVLIDLIIYTGVYDIHRLDDMLAVIGFILFASISCNLLYNYMTVRFGSKSIIIFRLITILYAYFIPYIPNIYIFFRSFLRIVYPYIIYLVLEYTYGKTNYATAYSDRKKNIAYTTILCIVMTLIIALISCRFRYGIIVIGSGSMTGSLNKGDAVIFEQYKEEPINAGTVIIYQNEEFQTVHRVVSVENVNGEYRYYTKGDKNQDKDEGYRLKEDIVGTIKFKIPYIGYPTLWLRDIFK
ncbi:MAG: signal peptidase I [Bacilli bacterium]|nr:signal peptidase I [Bacilli bacterium]